MIKQAQVLAYGSAVHNQRQILLQKYIFCKSTFLLF